MRPEDPNDELPPNLGLTIGFISSVILSIGYIIDTIGEGVTLYEANRALEIAKQDALEQNQQLSDILSKLNYLVDEIEELKKRG
ncbi:hypothetical protein [Bacillus sp. FJAT-22090]|uniref:hypothetical protein n=1 Tax=Bacillus sp. FJAT-22090 TaxID=1581038 RepID=UPI0011A385DF|nr:hypothetical protein [Bacillus sp. FJAT-22090]